MPKQIKEHKGKTTSDDLFEFVGDEEPDKVEFQEAPRKQSIMSSFFGGISIKN